MDDFEKIKVEVLKAYTRALKLLSYRPRSEKEIRDRLMKKEFDSMIIDQVIDKLKADKLLNDREFADWWAEQRQEFRGKSKYVIKRELAEKGVENEIADMAVSKAKDDYETAKAFLERKSRLFERYTGEEYTKKVAGFLQRKGYSWGIISKILKERNADN